MDAVPNETQKRILGEDLASALIRNFDPADANDSDTDDSFTNEVYFADDAQQQWDENMKQLEQAIFYVLCPIFGRLFGRRFAQRMWARFVNYRWSLIQDAAAP